MSSTAENFSDDVTFAREHSLAKLSELDAAKRVGGIEVNEIQVHQRSSTALSNDFQPGLLSTKVFGNDYGYHGIFFLRLLLDTLAENWWRFWFRFMAFLPTS